MSPKTPSDTGVQELDVRGMRKPDKHPTIFATYDALPVGGAFVLVNDHDPQHLHEEFEIDHAGSYSWEYLSREMRDWRIQITKLAATPLPRALTDTTAITADTAAADVTGAVWKLQGRQRDLDPLRRLHVQASDPRHRAGTRDRPPGGSRPIRLSALSGRDVSRDSRPAA